MSFQVKSDPGNQRMFVNIGEINEKTKRGIRQGWFRFGKDLRATANQEILRRPKSGRTYILRSRGGRRRRHVASAPGETHANLSGRLRRSLSWKVFGSHSMEFGYGVSTRAADSAPDYAGFVEFGTSKMAARPSLKNAIDGTVRNAEQHFSKEIMVKFNAR